ncbi:hypothetical protein [Streptomyces pseudovenezuelae]|uniref:Teichoic acid biosynthesis protein C n=1 Tax=Streptomyces pseudovenezuelae TaxID=67350 RepID=A0ABT6LKZ7_9ACTN|nr:hypothetical protein [Streptomyces pseudovenezuelae]MDH6216980.1 hypothetical protein [Streptomyces pseudovenezuelae]
MIRPLPLAAPLSAALLTAAALVVPQLSWAAPEHASAATARLAELAGDVRAADGSVLDARDDTGRTMDTAQIVQGPGGGYLAVYHTTLPDGRFHAAVATSADLRTWTGRHDFGVGSSQPSLASDGSGGYVLGYEKDPANHIALHHYPDLAALLAGNADRAFDAPRTLSRCAEGTPDLTSVHGDTVELTGHYRAGCDTDRQLRAVLTDFTHWRARPDHRLDRALLTWGTGGNIGDRSGIELNGGSLVLIEGQRWRGDFGSWRTYAYDPVTGRADRLAIRTPGGSRAFANPSAALITAPNGRPALLVSLFVPKEGAAPGESGELIYWRELAR